VDEIKTILVFCDDCAGWGSKQLAILISKVLSYHLERQSCMYAEVAKKTKSAAQVHW